MVTLTVVMLTDDIWLDVRSAVHVVNGIVVFFRLATGFEEFLKR